MERIKVLKMELKQERSRNHQLRIQCHDYSQTIERQNIVIAEQEGRITYYLNKYGEK